MALFAGSIFSTSKIFLETREEKKNHRELYQDNRVDRCSRKSHPVRCTPCRCSSCGCRQRYLASVQSPLVLASHRQWHCVSLSTTVCQGMCSCKISNIIYFTSLQIGLGTAKTLPPNTSLILQAMAIFTPDWNSAALSRF